MQGTDKARNLFASMVVYKSAARSKQFAALSIPPYLRDWLVMRFSDIDGHIDMDEVHQYVKTTIPRRADWEALKGRMVKEGEPVRFLARAQVQIDVRTGEGLFSLPDLGFPQRKYEAVIDRAVVHARRAGRRVRHAAADIQRAYRGRARRYDERVP